MVKKSMLGMVLLKTITVFMKTRCNIARSTTHMFDLPLSLMNTRHNELERRQNLAGGPHHQMIVLLTSLMVWIVLLQFFCLKTSVYFVQCCTEIQAKSLKVLMEFYCKQCLNCDIKKIKEDSEVEAKLTSTINFVDNLRLIAEVRHLP